MDSNQTKIIKEIREKGKQAGKMCQMLSFFARKATTSQDELNISLTSLSTKFKNCMNVCGHIHDMHFHGILHQFNTDNVYDSTIGKKVYDTTLTASEILLKEQSDYQDFDNNNLIWCKDFCIDPYDTDVPPSIRRAQLNNPLYLKLPMMTWTEYMETVSVHLPWKTRSLCIRG